MDGNRNHKLRNYLLVVVSLLIIIRLLFVGMLPLLDKTESRYAEIARLMSDSGEWVVLQIEYGIPFWAKPPLSTWLSAVSFKVFGVSEWASRLPSFLTQLLLLVWLGAMSGVKKRSVLIPAFVLLSTPEFLIHTGVVSTDTSLAACIALAMIAFWKAMQEETRNYWKYLFFVGLGLGLLAKGPIVLILTLPPIFVWLVWHRVSLKTVLAKSGWQLGIPLMFIISLPWYILAERRSPGFLDYFIAGEHFRRFFDTSWKGDLYGSIHVQPRGMIWLFLLLFAFPWIQVVLFQLWKKRKTIFGDKRTSFLIFWLFWTPLFFSMSTSILHTYTLPVMVPMALLIVHWWDELRSKRIIWITSAIFPVLLIFGSIAYLSAPQTAYYLNTDKYLLEQTANTEIPMVYWKQPSYSGQFYTGAPLQIAKTPKILNQWVEQYQKVYVRVSSRDVPHFLSFQKYEFVAVDSTIKAKLFLIDISE